MEKQLTRCTRWPSFPFSSRPSSLFSRGGSDWVKLWRHHPPPGLSSITASHSNASNQCNYQSAITLTWLRTLLILTADKCWPSQSAEDEAPLISTPSIFDVSWLTAGTPDLFLHFAAEAVLFCFAALPPRFHPSRSRLSVLFSPRFALLSDIIATKHQHVFHPRPFSVLKLLQIVILMMRLAGKI